MIKSPLQAIALVTVTSIMLAACSERGSGDYCDDHFEVHAGHIDTVAELSIVVSEIGSLEGRLLIPESIFGGVERTDIEALLARTESTFSMQTTSGCSSPAANLHWNDDILEVSYTADCGTDNKVEKVNISLFDHVSGLEEVVASVTTPATAKRFAISRQCDAPLFRLD